MAATADRNTILRYRGQQLGQRAVLAYLVSLIAPGRDDTHFKEYAEFVKALNDDLEQVETDALSRTLDFYVGIWAQATGAKK